MTDNPSQLGKKLGALGASKGGRARANRLTAEERREIARKAAEARWSKDMGNNSNSINDSMAVQKEGIDSINCSNVDGINKESQESLPRALYSGVLRLGNIELPCYVLDNGQRVISRSASTKFLIGLESGQFERTISVNSLKPFLDSEKIISQLISFRIEDTESLGLQVKGLPADLLIEVCRGFVAALEASYFRSDEESNYPRLTSRQEEIAVKASVFLASVAKVGLDALIDEATGYQDIRDKNALEIKLRAYLAEEMRKWEKTFPDELWIEFGRLTNWGNINKRPKYWGKLVMELIYEYLDADVAQWLRENAPKPKTGQNYHQWLSEQYGLKKLIEHIWMVIGMAKTCSNINELKHRMAEYFGKDPIQLTLKLTRKDIED